MTDTQMRTEFYPYFDGQPNVKISVGFSNINPFTVDDKEVLSIVFGVDKKYIAGPEDTQTTNINDATKEVHRYELGAIKYDGKEYDFVSGPKRLDYDETSDSAGPSGLEGEFSSLSIAGPSESGEALPPDREEEQLRYPTLLDREEDEPCTGLIQRP